jgi:hypothetical protein
MAMRIQIGLMCAALLLSGCVHSNPPASVPAPAVKQRPPETYITPALGPVGRVEMVNIESRFVVLSFLPGNVPPAGQGWRINHRGLKIGRVKITGPQLELSTVADIVEGEANVGDEAVPE